MSEVRLRPIAADEGHALYGLFRASLAALLDRYTEPWQYDADDDAATWPAWAGLYGHLHAQCDLALAAEVDGALAGYARSMRRADVRELTEFFVAPGAAGAGVGRRLLDAVLPTEAGVMRLIIATGDPSAQSRYIRAGFATHAHLLELDGVAGSHPELAPVTDLVAAPLDLADPAHLDAVAAIDEAVLGHRRDVDQRFYAAERTGRRFLRDGRVVGYGWIGSRTGPVAALDPADLPAMLHALEAVAVEQGRTEIGWNVPGTAQPAAAWLLARGFRLWRMPVFLMSDGPALPGRFDRYVVTSPPFFL
ncbi:MAG: GNAT family N-acetyltransferase [Chloroflexota bacterium]